MSSDSRNQTHRVAVDIGGTFTDIATLAPDGTVATHKLLSTPADYADGVLHGLLAHLQQRTLGPQDIDEVLHACTVATNTVLEAKGARTALRLRARPPGLDDGRNDGKARGTAHGWKADEH